MDILGGKMNKVWFFIANPKIAKWEYSEGWVPHEGHNNWGIPNNSVDMEKLNKLDVGDIILCYHTYDKELIGYCNCTSRIYEGDVDKEKVDPDFINRIGITRINNFDNPVSFEDLKQMNLKFIEEYRRTSPGRSIVEVTKEDWIRLKKNMPDFQSCINIDLTQR